MRQRRASPASKARRARFCVKPFRPRHHRLPRGPSREAVVLVCLMHPTKGFRLMTGSTVSMPSNLSLTDCKARVTTPGPGCDRSMQFPPASVAPLPPAAAAAVWAPPAMAPRTKAKSPTSTPAPLPHRIAVRGLPSRRRLGLALRFRLCLALPCRQRHGQTERYCPASSIAD